MDILVNEKCYNFQVCHQRWRRGKKDKRKCQNKNKEMLVVLPHHIVHNGKVNFFVYKLYSSLSRHLLLMICGVWNIMW